MENDFTNGPRLGDLTREMAHKSKIIAANQFLWLMAKHRGERALMQQEAQRNRFQSTDLTKVLMAAIPAADPATAGWAAELAPYAGLTVEWVKSLTAKTILGQLQCLRVPFLTKTIADVTPGSAAWVAPGDPIPMSRMTVAATDRLDIKKVCALVPVDDESLQSWEPAVQANVEDLIGRVVRYTIDQSLLDPDLSVTAARPASLTNGIAAGQSTGSSAAQAMADIKAMLTGPLTGTQAPERVVIVMSPTSALHLSQLLTAGNTYAFPELGALGGKIWGVPVIASPAAALLGSPAANIIAAIDASRIIVADDNLMLVDASNTASLTFTDNPSGAQNQVSLFQTNTTALRISMYKNFVRANATAVSWFAAGY